MSLELLILKVFQRFRMAPRLTVMLSLTGNRLLMGMHTVNWFCALISCASLLIIVTPYMGFNLIVLRNVIVTRYFALNLYNLIFMEAVLTVSSGRNPMQGVVTMSRMIG